MIYATAIKMKVGYKNSYRQDEIDSIYLSGYINQSRWYKKEDVYDMIDIYNKKIHVNIHPYPVLITAISPNGEKYVKSVSDNTIDDNLMRLPRC